MSTESSQLAQQIEEEIRRLYGDKTFNQLVEMEKQAMDVEVTETHKSAARLSGALLGVAISLAALSLIQPELAPFTLPTAGIIVIVNYHSDIIRLAKVTGEIIWDAAKPGWERIVKAWNEAKEDSPELRDRILAAWKRAGRRISEIVQNGITGLKNAAKSIRERGKEVANKLKRKPKNNNDNIKSNNSDSKLQNPILGGDREDMNKDLLQNPVLDSDRWTQARLNKIAMLCIIAIIILIVVFPSSGLRTVSITVAVGVLIAVTIGMRILRAKRIMADFNYEQDRALRERIRRGENIEEVSVGPATTNA
jgi:hypothetical protein